MGTSTSGTSPARTARKQSTTEGKATASRSAPGPASSSRASSANVPGGPR